MAKTYITCCLLLSVFCFFQAGAQSRPAASFGGDDTSTIVQIDSERVTKGEFIWRMNGFRSACFNFFMQQYNASYNGPDFWEHPFNSITPMEWIRKRTLQQLVEDKVKIKIMQQYGVLRGFDYAQFLKAFRDENEKRKILIEQGQVIYGMQEFDARSFYEYVLSNALLETERRMLEVDPPSEKELRDYKMQVAAARFRQILERKIKEAKIKVFSPAVVY